MLLGARVTKGITTSIAFLPARKKKLLGAPGTRSKKLLGAPGPTTRSKGLLALLLGARTLLEAPGLTTRSKDATRGSWPYY